MTADGFLDRLAKDHGIEDRGRLLGAINSAVLVYDGTRNADPPDTLDELDEPLSAVIKLLSRDANHQRLIALATKRAEETSDRLCDLVDQLKKLRRAARRAHVRPALGRPPVAKNLYAFVDVLAGYWISLGREFTQHWQAGVGRKDKPLTDATRFVYALVKRLDPSRLPELPEVTKAVVKDIRAQRRRAS